ncbi:hypothetical protein MRB53_037746 [Persea americana]|nr:hypothetical protein MRB53_037746 [Persea americana]
MIVEQILSSNHPHDGTANLSLIYLHSPLTRTYHYANTKAALPQRREATTRPSSITTHLVSRLGGRQGRYCRERAERHVLPRRRGGRGRASPSSIASHPPSEADVPRPGTANRSTAKWVWGACEGSESQRGLR